MTEQPRQRCPVVSILAILSMCAVGFLAIVTLGFVLIGAQ